MSNPVRPIILWRFSDGRAGHDTQSRGLTAALSSLADCRVFEIPTNLRAGLWAGLLLRRFDPGQDLPDPDLIIGAGHRTHLPMLRARRARGGRIVVLMRPSLPLSWFDLCLVPAHDRITAGDNVWLTRGALNSIIRSETKDPRSGVILIGGPSKHYLWDEPELLAQIGRVATRLPAVQP